MDTHLDDFVGEILVKLQYYRRIDSMAIHAHEVIIKCNITYNNVEHIHKKNGSKYVLTLSIYIIILILNGDNWEVIAVYNILHHHIVFIAYNKINTYYNLLFVIFIILSIFRYAWPIEYVLRILKVIQSVVYIYHGHHLSVYGQHIGDMIIISL